MARQFDLSAGSRGIQQEAQIGQIQAQAQNTALSFYERQQNMRLKELQNDRQQMLAETQIKMNEANLRAAEMDLEIKAATQDALIQKANYDNQSALYEINKNKRYMQEETAYREKSSELNAEYEETCLALSAYSNSTALANWFKGVREPN